MKSFLGRKSSWRWIILLAAVLALPHEARSARCFPKFEFPCADGIGCVPNPYKCNGIRDCRDNSDEHDCPNSPKACRALFEFTCADGKGCVPSSYRCNGISDCLDRSDELDCPTKPAATTKSAVKTTTPPTTAATTSTTAAATQAKSNTSPTSQTTTPSPTTTAPTTQTQAKSNTSPTSQTTTPSPTTTAPTTQMETTTTASIITPITTPKNPLDLEHFYCEIKKSWLPDEWICDGTGDCFDENAGDHIDERDCLPTTLTPTTTTTTPPPTTTTAAAGTFETIELFKGGPLEATSEHLLVIVLCSLVGTAFAVLIIAVLILGCRRFCQSEQPSPVGKGQVKVIVESGDGVNRLKKSPPPTGGIEVVPYHQPPVPAYTQAPVPMVTMANGAGQSTSVPAKKYTRLLQSSL